MEIKISEAVSQSCQANDLVGRNSGILLVFANARNTCRFELERGAAMAVDSGPVGHGHRMRGECQEMQQAALPMAKEFGVEVEEAPWGFEIEIRDPDANRLRIGMPKSASSGS